MDSYNQSVKDTPRVALKAHNEFQSFMQDGALNQLMNKTLVFATTATVRKELNKSFIQVRIAITQYVK